MLEICSSLNCISKDIEKNIEFISQKTNTKTVCVTRGGNGAVLFIDNVFYENEGYKVNVKDTVGAGDFFLATLIDKLLKKEKPQKALDFGCAVGALVASNDGANPEIKLADIKVLMN